jgi:hypothetical protein
MKGIRREYGRNDGRRLYFETTERKRKKGIKRSEEHSPMNFNALFFNIFTSLI